MTQNVLQIPTAAPLSGMALVTDVNNALAGLASLCSGGTAPTASSLGLASMAGLLWHDTQANLLKLRNQADSAWITLGSVNETSGVFTPAGVRVTSLISANTTLALANAGQFLLCSAAITLTLPTSSALTTSWSVSIFAKGGPVTLALATGTDTLNGTANGTQVIPKGYYAEIVTDAAGNYTAIIIPASLGISTLASASTVDLGASASQVVSISGATSITSFGSSAPAGTVYTLLFAASPTLIYNAVSLILPGAAPITTAANDCAQVLSLGSGNWICIDYQRASGQPVAASASDLTNQIILLNLRLELSTQITTGALIQGKQWELLTDEWGATSTGQTYTSGPPGYYEVSTADLTPAMTSNTTPSGTVTSSSTYAGFYDWSAFDRTSACWIAGALSGWVAYDFGTSKVIAKYAVGGWDGAQTAARAPKTWTFEGWTGSAWVVLDTQSNQTGWAQSEVRSFSISNATGYNKYRLNISANNGDGGYLCLNELRLYPASLSMTLLPPAAVALLVAPTYANCYFLYHDDSGSAVPGTDLTVELSGNGTYWSSATITILPLGGSGIDGTYAAIRARANLSGSPSGTNLTARIKTLNGKAQRIGSPGIFAE